MEGDERVLGYRGARPESTEGRVGFWLFPLIAAVVQIPWHFAAAFALFFFEPFRWVYLAYDIPPLRCVDFLVVGLPAIVAGVTATRSIRRSGRSPADRAGLACTIPVLLLACAYLIWLFYAVVIDAADPRAPGYWL